MARALCLALLSLWLIAAAAAQTTVDGTVADAETGAPLAGANVAVVGPGGAVVGGTSTNAEGRFSLRLASLPADVAVRFLGYETERLTIAAPPDADLRVALAPEPVQIGGVDVVAGADPAADLMRRVIARTRAQRAALGAYAVTAYARTTIRAPDDAVKGVVEAVSDAYWSPGAGWRETVVASRQTGNLAGGAGAAGAVADGLLDLLAADVEVAGHRLMGPTHPDALGTYRYEIVGSQALDGRLVVEVALAPRRATASAFVGTLQVLFETADVLAADLRPGPSFLFPPPVQITGARYRQQYVPVAADSSLWLPADLRSAFAFGIALDALLYSEPFTIERAAQLSDYRLGAAVPDSLREGPAVRRAAAPDSSRLADSGVAVPLTDAEVEAYAAGDDLGSIEDVLVLRGPLAPLARGNIVVSGGAAPDSVPPRPSVAVSPSPRLQVNPAEQLFVGAGLNARVAGLRLAPYAAYRLADGGVSLGVDASLPVARPAPGVRVSAVGGAADDVARRVAPSAPDLSEFFVDGRGGYYASRQASAGLAVSAEDLGTISTGGFAQFTTSAAASVRFVAETARPYETGSPADSDLLGFDSPLGVTTRSLRARAAVGTLDVPLGVLPRRALAVTAEWAPASWGGPAFWRADAAVDWRVPTLGRRRALPAALDVRLSGGVSGGALPAFRQFAVEHALGDGAFASTTFGALRSRTDTPEAGDRYAMLAWDHSFRTLPFEALGLPALARRGYNVIVHGASARTWGGPLAADAWHHEVGVSLSGVLGLFRVDLTQRLDRADTVVGVGVARVF